MQDHFIAVHVHIKLSFSTHRHFQLYNVKERIACTTATAWNKIELHGTQDAVTVHNRMAEVGTG